MTRRPSRAEIARRTRRVARAVGGAPERIRASQLVRRSQFPLRPPSVPRGVEPLPPAKGTGVDFETDWARTVPSRVARAALLETVVRPVVTYFARPTRRGLDRLAELPTEEPVIFVANHHSHFDTPLILTSIPRPWRSNLVVGAAADYFFGTRLTAAVSAVVLGAIPIERTRVGRRSADLAAELLDDSWSFLIFPEGGRSPDGWGQPFRGGAAYLAIRCGVPVVPIHLAGTDRILRKGASRPRPSRATVTFGEPIFAADGENSRRLGERIEQAVAELADEYASDWWQAKKRAHADATPSLYGPEASSWRRAWNLGERKPSPTLGRGRWPSL